jgi:hypothetical protein
MGLFCLLFSRWEDEKRGFRRPNREEKPLTCCARNPRGGDAGRCSFDCSDRVYSELVLSLSKDLSKGTTRGASKSMARVNCLLCEF